MIGQAVYLDHNASTPPFPEVVEAMLPWLRQDHANPHSEHVHGRRAAAAVERAKGSIAALIGADADDVVLTSGATEANNLILQGYLSYDGTAALVHTAVEHRCVMEVAEMLAAKGVEVRAVPVNEVGRVEPAAVGAAVAASHGERVLVSVIHANNEIGTVHPLEEISSVLNGSRAVLHTDAAQTNGRIPVDVANLGVDFLTMSSHKIGGPMGIGGFYVARDLRSSMRPLMYGGGQQGGLRPGTVPVFLAVGFGVACDIARRTQKESSARAERVAEAFVSELAAQSCGFVVLGDVGARLPGLRSIRLLGVDATEVLDRLGHAVSASTGAACAAGELKPSHVLRAIGLGDREAREVVRFRFSSTTPLEHARAAAAAVAEACRASL